MNAHSNLSNQIADTSETARVAERFYTLSGKFIEKCAEAEGHVLALLSAHTAVNVQAKAPFIHKLKALRDASVRQTATDQEKKLLPILNELEALAELRTELAHSTMTTGWLDGQWTVFLKNAAERHPRIDRRVAVAPEDLQEAHRQLSDLVNRLGQLVRAPK